MPVLLGVLSAVEVFLLVAILDAYLGVIGKMLHNIADNLDDCNGSVQTIVGHAEVIIPGVDRINHTGGVVSGALPLLYGLAENVRDAAAPHAQVQISGASSAKVTGKRRSRLGEAVGYK